MQTEIQEKIEFSLKFTDLNGESYTLKAGLTPTKSEFPYSLSAESFCSFKDPNNVQLICSRQELLAKVNKATAILLSLDRNKQNKDLFERLMK